MVFNVSVNNKIAKLVTENVYGVCGNSDYTVQFTFDEEWAEFETKTLQVNYANKYARVIFTGNTCTLPAIPMSGFVEIGVFAGDLHTTTPAVIPFIGCITSKSGTPAPPAPNVYDQIIQMLQEAVSTANEALSDVETLSVDAVTLPEGSEATAEKSGGGEEPYHIRFGIPTGATGETGLGIDDVVDAVFTPDNDAVFIEPVESEAGTFYDVKFVGKIRQTLDDGTYVEKDAEITLPVNPTNGLVVGKTSVQEGGRTFLGIGNTSDPASTFVSQRSVPSHGSTRVGQPLIYGGYAAESDGLLNDLVSLPILLTPRGVVMYVGSDNPEDENQGVFEDGNYFNTMVGKGNILTDHNTENFISGGKNVLHAYVQDTATVGYRNEVYANQAFTSGYKNKNYSSESAIIGNQNIIYGTITSSAENGASSDSKYNAVSGFKNILQRGAESNLVSGDQNALNSDSKWNFLTGSHQNIGRHNVCVAALDYGNITGDYVEDSTMIGYYNHIYGGSAGHVVYGVNMLGNDNDNRDRNGTAKSEVTFVGSGLRAAEAKQTIIGRYNAYDQLWEMSQGCVVIGVGEDDSHRKTAARFRPNEIHFLEDLWLTNGAALKIGNAVLDETTLFRLLDLL